MVVKPEDVERLSPLLLDHINVLGWYEFVLTKSGERLKVGGKGVLTTFVGKPPIRASPPSIHGQNS